MPNFVPEAETAAAAESIEDSFLKDLSMPYPIISERFKREALDLKETIMVHRTLLDDFLYGKSGLLWACLFINKHIGKGTISSVYTRTIKKEIIRRGRALAKGGEWPLMFEWYRKGCLGAAYGLAGILHTPMDLELKPREIEEVKASLKYMIQNRFPSGNYPSSEEDKNTDILVHWCHGAPGIALMLVKAARVFAEEEFVQAAVDAGEVVWRRGLLERVGICHGISGNSYVFLSLYQLTRKVEYLYRAKAFACFLLDKVDCRGRNAWRR